LKVVKRALKLAEEFPVVTIMVPDQRCAKVLRECAWNYMPLEKTKEEAAEILRRLNYVSTEHGLRGIPREPLLADHSWYERYFWVMDVWNRADPVI
jgi:hypothetical protein